MWNLLHFEDINSHNYVVVCNIENNHVYIYVTTTLSQDEHVGMVKDLIGAKETRDSISSHNIHLHDYISYWTFLSYVTIVG
jgi:hypothetical protein